MTPGILCFGAGVLSDSPRFVAGKRILEVGARNINGSMRAVIEQGAPKEYIGVDIVAGPGVDVVWDATRLSEKFDLESFDAVVCTETIEHVEDYGAVLDGIAGVLKRGGWLFLSAPAPGFPKHDYPSDHHRFTTADLANEMNSRGFAVHAFAHTIENCAVAFGTKR